jgi:hypothetical protein
MTTINGVELRTAGTVRCAGCGMWRVCRYAVDAESRPILESAFGRPLVGVALVGECRCGRRVDA